MGGGASLQLLLDTPHTHTPTGIGHMDTIVRHFCVCGAGWGRPTPSEPPTAPSAAPRGVVIGVPEVMSEQMSSQPARVLCRETRLF